ncbi:MAG TPA: hypothetical protein VJS64_07325, partial [Pyrinomonadaceae bacterium]|nr:hypothetical protein [Pyrinomonadaceae bacterium]
MLRRTLFTSLCFTLTALTSLILGTQNTSTTSAIRRITLTSETALNLNPSISGDGRMIAFESTVDLANAGGPGFHALRADISAASTSFVQMALGRAVAPAISQDG